MDVREQEVFDGVHIKLSGDELIKLEDVKKVTIKLFPYLIFHVTKLNGEERERTLMKIIVPFTGDKQPDQTTIVSGETRPTHSVHYIDNESKMVKRKLDLLNPHKVELTGHRHIVIELKDGQCKTVGFDGNCMNLIEGIEQLQIGDHIEPASEYFDRASEILSVAKKNNITIMSHI
ncbi:hypothetical protein [Vagococcus xieshaowenii]|uniref:Uncharacterized protein n=1 Tax=Vagococcus xieshaowenii TaxID=2562451 RepID=A0AAJ5JLM9_9ENTE|nr:hypothetical protein [Vagococcus xieshaowenii]QCA28790.1 hypothetical protein E4Z98_05460 [Vagococcus xieshaowenii]TFZ43009.1 hypothetical protein E4031_01185 [Vagococcus xieshaowenii]